MPKLVNPNKSPTGSVPESGTGRTHSVKLLTGITGVFLVGVMVGNWGNNAYLKVPNSVQTLSTQVTAINETTRLATERLLGPDSHGSACPLTCGCPGTPQDCPRWYHPMDVIASVAESNPETMQIATQELKATHAKAMADCSNPELWAQGNGGWCVKPTEADLVVWADSTKYSMAFHHVPPSPRVVKELTTLIEMEGIQSINDFGAGIGQYGAALSQVFPPSRLQYRSYDGAGNVEEYTKGKLQYFDLTKPLFLPVADWVMSLEVGEHVPSKYEGVVIRNLHRHNRKGVILSWGILGQNGLQHINLHSNEYVIKVFDELGYSYDQELSLKFRNPNANYQWFEKSVMVFRRRLPIG